MKLDKHIRDAFANAVNTKKDKTADTNGFGTVTVKNDKPYVKMDGSESYVPASSVASVSDGDRVQILIHNHEVIITGNVTCPSGTGSGEKGETGPQGPQGEKGEKGDTGPQGPQGEKGEKGDTGPQGPQGEKGETGSFDGTIPEHQHSTTDITDFPNVLSVMSKLFSTNPTVFKSATRAVEDTDTLDNLPPGIYYIDSGSIRTALGIPVIPTSGVPQGASYESVATPGGLLIKLGCVLSGPRYYKNNTGSGAPYAVTSGCTYGAIFVDNRMYVYLARVIESKSRQQVGYATVRAWEWQALHTYKFPTANIDINRIVYLANDTTVASGSSHNITGIRGLTSLPYTGGTAYGPTKTYALSCDSTGSYLCIKNTGDSDIVLPAGRYLLQMT